MVLGEGKVPKDGGGFADIERAGGKGNLDDVGVAVTLLLYII